MANKNILVVDDSPTELSMITAAVKKGRYRVSTAVDGEEAMEKVAAEQPDLVVLDIILPKKNGFQVCRQLKTAPGTKDIPIILLSSKSQDSDRFWGLKQGADEYLCKPFDDDELLETIARLL